MFVDFEDAGVGKMVVMGVAYDNTVDNWNIGDVAGPGGESLVAQPGEGGAAVFEYGIKENAQTRGKLNVGTCVS